MNILEIDHVTVRFGDRPTLWRRALRKPVDRFTAVDDATLNVAEGEAVGIVGESGSGKTTLMRAVMGMTSIDEGEIRFRGRPLTPRRAPDTRRAVQMVFQDPGTTLNPSRTVGAAIDELLRVHRLADSPGARRARVAELFDRVQLPVAVMKSLPRELSGGQKQRVAIARSLALEPRILIADEATSALDVIVQASVLDLLRELRADTGITLLCITHDLTLVRYLCERAIVMRSGRIVEAGTVDSIFDRPQHAYTRELLDAVPQLPAATGGAA